MLDSCDFLVLVSARPALPKQILNLTVKQTTELIYDTNGTVGRKPEEVEAAKKLYPQYLGLEAFVKANINEILPK